MPHKVEIIPLLDQLHEIAKQIGAVNTVVNEDGVLTGHNTDWLGIVRALEKVTTLEGKQVALLGAGGAARAAAYGVTERGAKLTIYNRTLEKAQSLARDFAAEARSLADESEIKLADIIINTTSVGSGTSVEESPISGDVITSKHVVFDAVYNPQETRLLRDAKQKGAQVVYGAEMLLLQGMAQFQLYTDHEAPEDAMRAALYKALSQQGDKS
jgi:shikimate dehydrogenase